MAITEDEEKATEVVYVTPSLKKELEDLRNIPEERLSRVISRAVESFRREHKNFKSK